MSITPRRLGKYELQEPLGRGGTAEVWKAFDTQLRRYVAIKLLHADLETDPDFISRFTREAQVVAGLRHPNIVQIYDFHISESPVSVEEELASQSMIAYMVMEYIKGQTLAHYIHKTSRQGKFPPAAEIVRLFTPISLALDYAHQQGTIHRDIKPANILLDQRTTARNPMGEPILTDFGFAKLLDAASQTISGALFGTPLYISPEQVQGLPVSNRTDLYSFGVVLYEIFTGVPPFQGDSLSAIMRRHLTDIPTEPHILNPQLPTALSRVLLKSLAKNPYDRFSSAASMTAALAEAFDLPVPQDLNSALASTDDGNMPAHEAPLAHWPLGSSSSLAPADAYSSNPQVIVSSSDGPVSGEHYLPSSLPSVRGEAVSSPLHLPDSEAHGVAPPGSGADSAKQSVVEPNQEPIAPAQASSGTASSSAPVPASNPTPPSSPPDTPLPSSPPPTVQKLQGLRRALIALIILVLVGSGLGTFFLLAHRSMVATGGANTIVGHAFFVSSGQVNQATNQGSNDELQVDLQNISDPHSGKSYYAWLLPDKSQSEAPAILLGKVPVNHGVVHFFYAGDSYHTNLLGTTSRFLITEEDANGVPNLPSPDLTTWRYYAELPQTRAPGEIYSLLDHLRHLLAIDPTLVALHLEGGLDIWTFRNTQKLLEWAGSARDEWSTKDFASMHRQIVSILDYLDGEALVQQDVPRGTPILADPQIAQVGLLEFDPAHQNPPGYLYHIALHVNGVLASPGATQDQRHLAIQIDTAMNTVKGELEQMRRDAVQLVDMSNAQLALPSSLALLDDMATQANNAYMGHNDPSTGQFQKGVAQIYQDVQHLATFEVKPYQ